MGWTGKGEPIAKGPIVLALDEMSTSKNARSLLTKLRDHLRKIRTFPDSETRIPDYPGLADVLRDHLLKQWSVLQIPGVDGSSGVINQTLLDDMMNYLNVFWFGEKPKEFRQFKTQAIYGDGLLKVIDSSLRGDPVPIPIDAYWQMNHNEVTFFVLESKRQVTLLMSTPTPVSEIYQQVDSRAKCDAWVTTRLDYKVKLEVDPELLSPMRPINANLDIIKEKGNRICTFKMEGGA